jgi:hypothetical protein
MRTHISAAVFAAAIGSIPLTAVALDYYGVAGLAYDRLEGWQVGGEHAISPRLQLDGNMFAQGFVYSPSVLRWNGRLGYSSVRQTYLDTDDTMDGLNYQLALNLLDTPRSRGSLNASAGRSTVEHATEPAGGTRATGTTQQDYYQVGSTLRLPSWPGLNIGASRTDSTNSGFGRPDVKETTDQLNAFFSQGTGAYSVNASYEGRWNEGTLAPTNYVLHSVGVTGDAAMGDRVSVVLTDSYRQRIASTTDALNPTTEDNAFIASVRWRDHTNEKRGWCHYSYGHSLLEAPDLATRERFTHNLTATDARRYSRAWNGTTTLDLAFTRSRLGDVDEIGAGQTILATAEWQGRVGESYLLIEVGPKVGALEPEGGPVKMGYGAFGRTRWAIERPFSRYSIEYQIDTEANLHGLDGWSLRQSAQGEAATVLLSGLRARAHATGTGARQHLKLLGDFMSRQVVLGASLGWKRYGTGLEVGASDGPSLSLQDSFKGDGLFYPADFTTTSRYASLTATAAFSRVTASAFTRYTRVSGAGVLMQQEASVAGVLTYRLGRFRLSLEERYTAGGARSFDNRSNLVLVRLSRVFGGRL